MKTEKPEIMALMFGLATVVFAAKSWLATFWQNMPAIGYFWTLLGAATGVGYGWACWQVRHRKRQTKANTTADGIRQPADGSPKPARGTLAAEEGTKGE